jgi:outer membrane protein assembly factor BamA
VPKIDPRASAAALASTLLCWAASAPARADSPEPAKTEVGAVPLLGGNSDFGFGGGALGSVTRVDPSFRRFRWRLEVGGLAMFKHLAEEGWTTPYQDYYVLWTDPHLIRDRLRLELRPSYTAEARQLYYGIGNATPAPEQGPGGESAQQYYRYGRLHPTLLARLHITLAPGLYALTGLILSYNRIDVNVGSQLETDANTPAESLRGSFRSLDEHGIAIAEYAVIYDTRDDEIDTHRGGFHQIKLRLSPGGAAPFPYRYGQVNATARFFATPIRQWLTLAARVVADAQFGDPPFYELARYEDTYAVGGVKGVRGVPAQRYYGKIKAFTNLEARSEMLTVTIAGKSYTFGLAAFFDAGRVWSGWSHDLALDGTGVGLKWGIGGGLRFRQGNTFVVRGDIAWSPDAQPVGAYFAAGQIF